LKCANEVVELRVLPLILLEVIVKGLLEVLLAHHFVELLEEGSTFAIGDAVKD